MVDGISHMMSASHTKKLSSLTGPATTPSGGLTVNSRGWSSVRDGGVGGSGRGREKAEKDTRHTIQRQTGFEWDVEIQHKKYKKGKMIASVLTNSHHGTRVIGA